jgi:hypothetical protein
LGALHQREWVWLAYAHPDSYLHTHTHTHVYRTDPHSDDDFDTHFYTTTRF